MSEWRIDPLLGHSTLIAPDRAQRPLLADSATTDDDPFLEGNEHTTPPELFAIRRPGTEPNTPGWKVRVVPNRFPAVQPDSPSSNRQVPELGRPGLGAHEVIIECPHFETNLGRLPATSVTDVLHAYRERLRAHSADTRLKHAVIFKNQGLAAGATIPHSHSQLIAMQFLLPDADRRLEQRRAYFHAQGRSVSDDTLREELDRGTRVITDSDEFLVWCPRISRFSHEVRVLPKRPAARFESTADDQLELLGGVLKQTLRRIEAALGDPALNFILQTAPFGDEETPRDRWWFEIIPRLSGIGGFELGSGCFITSTLPEDAARTLREVPDAELR